MPVKTIRELGEDKATAVVYNHSKAKLFTRKNKVTRCRSETFLLITRRESSGRRYCTERRPSLSPSTRKPKLKLITEGTNCKLKLKLEVSIVSTSLHHGPQTLYFDLRRETAVSSLKELIGFQPKHERLFSEINFQLTPHKNAVDKDDIISLSTENPAQDEPNETYKPRDKEPEPGPHNDVREDEQNKQKGEPTPEGQTHRGEPARDSDGSRVSCFRCVKTKLQIFVRNSTPRGPKTLCLQLKPETCISTLKSLIFSKIGVQNQHQRLYIRRYFRNFQLGDLLTLGDYGIQQDENISLCLPTDGLLGGGQHDKVQVDEQFLRDLSTEVEESWIELAERLSYRRTEIWQISASFEGNKERSHQMLLSWWKKQTNPEERLERLREALTAIGLSKVILLVSGKPIFRTPRGPDLKETCQEESSIKGSMKSYRGGGLEQEERGQQKGTGTEGLKLEREGSSENWGNRTRREGDQDTSQQEKQQLREELRRCSQQEMSSSVDYEVSTSKEYEVSSSKEYEVSSSEDDKVLSSKDDEVSSSKEYEVSSSKEYELSSSEDYEVSPSKAYEVSSSKEYKVSSINEYEVMEGQFRYTTQNKQQLLTTEYQSTSRGMLPAPEENKIQKLIYQKPSEAQVDSFYGGHAEFQEKVEKQMSPLYQNSCLLGRDIAPSASQVGSPSVLSALQRHCSLQQVSVDALSIYGTNSPTFLAPVYQPTLQFVQNVTLTHNRLVETEKAVPTGQDIATECRNELEEQCTATGSHE
ncbi:uncharacterized protein LOC110990722 [Acanthaster planci]|uniref:Uncharacterized protein LOC110990722 n=1 Tax=Acanthaster planci TaxID=133434 RepID=A0A8B8A1G0_ACAPL|nr:uncharacterized protein LOC110990722 [Acanthaster planci]